MAAFDIESVIKRGVERALNEPIMNGKSVMQWAEMGIHSQEQPQWVSVEDKLPGIDEDVLILYESKVSPRKTGYAITCLKDSFYFGSTPIPYSKPQWSEPWQYFRENNVITHWMPLPGPPEDVMKNG